MNLTKLFKYELFNVRLHFKLKYFFDVNLHIDC